MKDELQQKLFDSYPKMFDRIRPKDGERFREGVRCGDGWFNIIDGLCFQLQHNSDKNFYKQTIINCCKEKFGGLRFYVELIDTPESIHWNQTKRKPEEAHWFDRPDSYLHGLIDMAESFANSICDVCGQQGKHVVIDNFLHATRCDIHNSERNY